MELGRDKEKAKPQWYVNGQGQVMVVIPGPVEFLMGSPPAEAERATNEDQHRRQIDRTFAIAAKPVTVRQYRRVVSNYPLPAKYTRTPDLPVVGINWYVAASYCNWLSKEEEIPENHWCYETKKGDVTKLKANYLSLAGYRLPTEAEMEYATRAGTITGRYYGETEYLLPKYAWYQKNSLERTWPVGSLKPNDLGLFDMHGHVSTWCQESYNDYPQKKDGGVTEDKEDGLVIVSTRGRVLRGGSFFDRAVMFRSAFRNSIVPSNSHIFVGIRPARTFR
jgi:formylglycine-generating enzyme required for sulfatase activity